MLKYLKHRSTTDTAEMSRLIIILKNTYEMAAHAS